MMRKAFAGLFALTLALAAPAFAQNDVDTEARTNTEARVPNFFGSTGLFTTPSAYTQRNNSGAVYFAGTEDLIGGGAVVGLGDRFEIGASVLDIDGGDTEVLLNAKFNLLKETNQLPAISVGVIDAFDSLDLDQSWFVVASKYFTRADTDQDFALKGHVGFGGGIYDEEIFAGAELFFGRNLSAVAEYVNGNFNIGGRVNYRGWTGSLVFFDVSDIGGQIAYHATLR